MGERLDTRIDGRNRRLAGVLAAVIGATTLIPAGLPGTAIGGATGTDGPPPNAAGPRLIAGEIADALVLVRGGSFCSGTPITDTRYVMTAAHCVLDRDGRPARRTVVRGEVTYSVDAVWVDTRYAGDPSPRYDAAILELDGAVPGPAATLGTSTPAHGSLTIAGYQPIDTDGTLLRGERPDDRPLPEGVTGGVIEIESRPAGCTAEVSATEQTEQRLDVACGLIPSASGGGLFAQADGEVTLVGIISTVAYDLSSNGVVPLASIHELLDNPVDYRYPVNELTSPDAASVARS